MFTALISTLTDTEIAADIATCRAVLASGSVNGITLDSDSEGYYRDWLECAEDEMRIRQHPEDYETPVPVREAA